VNPLSTRRRRWLLAISALAIGIAEPHVEIAWKCRAGLEASEACVWGRAFLPLGKWLAPVFVAPIAFIGLLVCVACLDWVRARVRPAADRPR
jgi:hypothetical protein